MPAVREEAVETDGCSRAARDRESSRREPVPRSAEICVQARVVAAARNRMRPLLDSTIRRFPYGASHRVRGGPPPASTRFRLAVGEEGDGPPVRRPEGIASPCRSRPARPTFPTRAQRTQSCVLPSATPYGQHDAGSRPGRRPAAPAGCLRRRTSSRPEAGGRTARGSSPGCGARARSASTPATPAAPDAAAIAQGRKTERDSCSLSRHSP